MFFGRGLENPAGLRFVFGRGMGNRVGIGPRFVRGMDFWVGIRFIRPLVWPSVGRMQYAPTRVPEKMAIFLSIRPPAWPSMGRMLLRPYTGDLKNGDFSIYSTTGVAACGAYVVALYTDYRKPTGNRVRISRGGGKGGGAWVVRKVG